MKKTTVLSAALSVASGVFAAFVTERPAPEKLVPARELTETRVYKASSGLELPYRIQAPARTEAGRKYPLVVLLHGSGERGTNNVAQLVHGATDILNFMRVNGVKAYFIAPQCPDGQQWSDYGYRHLPAPTAPMAALLEFLDVFVKKNPVDADRLLVTGISMGGYGTWDAIMRRPGMFAAAMPCCSGSDARQVWRVREMPIWVFHGAADSVVPVHRSREMVSALWTIDGNVRYTEYPGVNHDCWVPLYSDWKNLAWFFSQSRGR